MSQVQPGMVFTLNHKDGSTRLVIMVTSVERVDGHQTMATVLVLHETEEFRAANGETTDWIFNDRDPEWERLRRVS